MVHRPRSIHIGLAPSRSTRSSRNWTRCIDARHAATAESRLAQLPRPPAESAHVVSALRRCRSPVVARVVVEGSRPVRAATDRQGFAGGRVVRSAGPWRVSGWWWGEGPGKTPWNREEWEVSLTDGSIYRMFQDCDTDRWFLDAIVD